MNKLIWIDENTSITDKEYVRLVWCAVIGVWAIIGGISYGLCKLFDWFCDWKYKKVVEEQEEIES